MNDEAYLRWASKIGQLTEDQAKNVLFRLKALKKIPADTAIANPEEEDEDDWLYQGLVITLRSKGILAKSAIYRLKQTRGYRVYLKDSPKVRANLMLLVPRAEGRTAARATLAHVAANALVAWCGYRKGLPRTPSAILSMVCHTMEAIEAQFPGYIAANLFHLVIRTTTDG